MQILTIGYAKKSAKEFFEIFKSNQIDLLVDVRLYNSSQLAGFSKSRDLQYFLDEICGCAYVWAEEFAPTPALLNGYKSGMITWSEYEIIYRDLLRSRDRLDFFERFSDQRVCLLCAESAADRCHRRLLAEQIEAAYENVAVTHL
jgi:uncharacterized protein (DUF488 family)